MEKINKCFRIHLDLSLIKDLDLILKNLIILGNLTILDNSILIWLDNTKEKKDLLKQLKKSSITDFFCEPIEYDNIGKGENFNYTSAWFLENYNNYVVKQIEAQKQDELRQMYDNIEKAKTLLIQKQECLKDSDDKNNNEGANNG